MSDLEQEVLDDLAKEVDELSEEELREELRKTIAADAKRKQRQAEYNKTPEAIARRKEYQEKTKDQRKEYNRKRNAKRKMLLAKAAEVPGLVEMVEKEVASVLNEEADDDEGGEE